MSIFNQDESSISRGQGLLAKFDRLTLGKSPNRSLLGSEKDHSSPMQSMIFTEASKINTDFLNDNEKLNDQLNQNNQILEGLNFSTQRKETPFELSQPGERYDSVSKVEILNQENIRLQAAHSGLVNQINSLQTEVARLNHLQKQKDNSNKNADHQIATLFKDIGQRDAIISDLNIRMNSIDSDNRSMRDNMERCENQKKAALLEKQQLTDRLAHIERDFMSTKSRSTSADGEIFNLRRTLDHHESEKAALVSSLNSQLSSKTSQYEELQRRLEAIQGDSIQKDAVISDLKARINSIDSDNRSMRDNMERCENQKKAALLEKQQLTDRLAHIERDFMSTKSRSTSADGEIFNLRRTLDHHESEKAALVSSLNSQLSSKTSQCEELQKRLQACTSENEGLKTQMFRYDQDLQRLTSELRNAHNLMNYSDDEKRKLLSTIQDQAYNKSSQVVTLEKDLFSMSSELARTRNHISSLESERNSLMMDQKKNHSSLIMLEEDRKALVVQLNITQEKLLVYTRDSEKYMMQLKKELEYSKRNSVERETQESMIPIKSTKDVGVQNDTPYGVTFQEEKTAQMPLIHGKDKQTVRETQKKEREESLEVDRTSDLALALGSFMIYSYHPVSASS